MFKINGEMHNFKAKIDIYSENLDQDKDLELKSFH